MSFDLYVWHEPAPITADVADAKVQRWLDGDAEVFVPHPAVPAVREALLQRFPPLESLSDAELDTSGVWSMTPAASDAVLVLSCRWPFADEVGAAVRALAASHGLVCYQPGGRILNPSGSGQPHRFTVQSMTEPETADPEPALLERLVRGLTAEHHFVVLERSDGSYAQVGFGRRAGAAPGTYALEHRAGPDGAHLRAETRDRVAAARFLQQFRAGDEQWRKHHNWRLLIL